MAEDPDRIAADDSPDDSDSAETDSAVDAEAPVATDARSGVAAEPESSTGDPSGDHTDGSTSGGGRPEVVVPMDLYKVVTVFSTLFAVALVVGGMIALDAATGRATLAADEIHLPIATLGVAAIVLGAGLYAFAARFRAEGMGNPKDGDDEG